MSCRCGQVARQRADHFTNFMYESVPVMPPSVKTPAACKRFRDFQ